MKERGLPGFRKWGKWGQSKKVYHVVSNYLEPELSIDRIKQNLKDNRFASSYIEAAAVDHCKRWAPTYYIKGSKGEVDIVLVQGNSMYPVEVKWTMNIRPEDLKQVQNYKNGIILSPRSETTMLKNNVVLPLTRFLIHTGYHRLLLE